jgi:SAM-dependent methyltransferase
MDFPNGQSVTGVWDIRGRFEPYIGHYPIAGKDILDVGSASGFLAFSAEMAKAKSVTATDFSHISELTLLPFQEISYYSGDRVAWEREAEKSYRPFKNSFWYAWHQYQSRVEMIYAPLADFRYWDRQFDVVIAGAILEHLSDPVGTLGMLARLAKEAVIIAFTPIEDTDDMLMRPITDLSNPTNYYTWWSLSRGLYRCIFRNVGFPYVDIVPAKAFAVKVEAEFIRPTLIALRG